MVPIRGHTASGLKQDLRVRVYAPAPDSPSGSGQLEIDGHTFRFSSLAEARRLVDEYLTSAFERAASGDEPRPH
jgi:hypothetical protein